MLSSVFLKKKLSDLIIWLNQIHLISTGFLMIRWHKVSHSDKTKEIILLKQYVIFGEASM